MLAINVLYAVSGAIHYPLGAIDVYSIWLLKAKEFYVNGIFPLSNLNQFSYSHPQYPILLPLIYSFIYQIIGGVKEIYVIILSPVAYISVLILAYKLFYKLNITENISLLLTYIFSMFGPLLAGGGRMHAGEADIFLILIYWGILHLIINYLNDNKSKWGLMIAILIALASQIKLEGLLPAFLFFFLPAKNKDKLIWILISIIPSIIWTIIIKINGVTPDFGFTIPELLEFIIRFGTLIFLIIKEMVNYRNWYIFWPIFWLLIYKLKQNNNIYLKVITKTLLALVSLYMVNFLFSSLDIMTYAPSSIDRIMLQLSPFFFSLFALNIFAYFKGSLKEGLFVLG